MPFRFEPLAIHDVILITPRAFRDQRGFLMETYRYSEFFSDGIKERFVQHNHSRSTQGVLRGLHYQRVPKAQGKLVQVIVGEIFDVAVDIRQGSPTYGKWVSERLSAENSRMLYIPPGFAHGFCVLSELAEVLYMTTEEYSPEDDAGIRWNDPEVDIQWPIEHPILSAKDARLPFLRELR